MQIIIYLKLLLNTFIIHFFAWKLCRLMFYKELIINYLNDKNWIYDETKILTSQYYIDIEIGVVVFHQNNPKRVTLHKWNIPKKDCMKLKPRTHAANPQKISQNQKNSFLPLEILYVFGGYFMFMYMYIFTQTASPKIHKSNAHSKEKNQKTPYPSFNKQYL